MSFHREHVMTLPGIYIFISPFLSLKENEDLKECRQKASPPPRMEAATAPSSLPPPHRPSPGSAPSQGYLAAGSLQAAGGRNTRVWRSWSVPPRSQEYRDLGKFRACPLGGSGALPRRDRPGAFSSRSPLQSPTTG